MTDNAKFEDGESFRHILEPLLDKSIDKCLADLIGQDQADAHRKLNDDIVAMMVGFMNEKQCACTHTYDCHGSKGSALTPEKIQETVKKAKGFYVPLPCMACTCQEYETDNLEWLLKREKWER